MPFVECTFVVRLQRKHRRDLVAAQHRHPDERTRHEAAIGWRSGDEDRGALSNRPPLTLQVLALESARPWRNANQHRLSRLVRLARRTRDGERDGGKPLFHAGDVLISRRDRPLRCLRDRGEDEAVEAHEARELLAQRPHDRPAIEARCQPASDRVDDLEPSPLVLDRLIAARVAQRERNFVGHELEERRRRVLVEVWPLALDAERAAHDAPFFDRDPQRG